MNLTPGEIFDKVQNLYNDLPDDWEEQCTDGEFAVKQGNTALILQRDDDQDGERLRVPNVIILTQDVNSFTELLMMASQIIDFESGEKICVDTDVDSYDLQFGMMPEHNNERDLMRLMEQLGFEEWDLEKKQPDWKPTGYIYLRLRDYHS